jgi:hypothetical protein
MKNERRLQQNKEREKERNIAFEDNRIRRERELREIIGFMNMKLSRLFQFELDFSFKLGSIC